MENATKTPYQRKEENYKILSALIRNFRAHRNEKGVNYDSYYNDCEDKFINWVIEQYPIINENKLVCFIGVLELEKEEALMKILTDLITIGVITIDTNKLPNDIEFVCHPRDITMWNREEHKKV